MTLLEASESLGETPTMPLPASPWPAVLLCADLAQRGLDLDELRAALATRMPALQILVVDHLCSRPDAVAATLLEAGATRAVLAACRRRLPEAELRARTRRNGSEAHDIQIVRVSSTRGTAAATTTIAAAVARLALTPRGEPSRTRATTGGLSRGALLRLAPAFSLKPVAAIDADRCVGFPRCGLCAHSCPAGAISASGLSAEVRASACEACGLCLASCPVSAIHIAAATPRQIETQLATLLERPEPTGLILACTRAVAALDDEPALDDWALLELPALAAVTPGWVLQALLAGASQIQLLPCDGACCSPWREHGMSRDLCQQLLPPPLAARVSLGGPCAPPSPAAPTPALTQRAQIKLTLAEPEATASALQALDASIVIRHPASPLGLLELAEGCTTCGACASACPVASLTLHEDDATTALLHDPRRCTGCALCAQACPEDVLRVEQGIDTSRLVAGVLQLASTPRQACRACGSPLPPQAIIDRNRRLLTQRWPLLAGAEPSLCLACASQQQPGRNGTGPSQGPLPASTLSRKLSENHQPATTIEGNRSDV